LIAPTARATVVLLLFSLHDYERCPPFRGSTLCSPSAELGEVCHLTFESDAPPLFPYLIPIGTCTVKFPVPKPLDLAIEPPDPSLQYTGFTVSPFAGETFTPLSTSRSPPESSQALLSPFRF